MQYTCTSTNIPGVDPAYSARLVAQLWCCIAQTISTRPKGHINRMIVPSNYCFWNPPCLGPEKQDEDVGFLGSCGPWDLGPLCRHLPVLLTFVEAILLLYVRGHSFCNKDLHVPAWNAGFLTAN